MAWVFYHSSVGKVRLALGPVTRGIVALSRVMSNLPPLPPAAPPGDLSHLWATKNRSYCFSPWEAVCAVGLLGLPPRGADETEMVASPIPPLLACERAQSSQPGRASIPPSPSLSNLPARPAPLLRALLGGKEAKYTHPRPLVKSRFSPQRTLT